MNTAFTLAECFATAAFANRFPSWREYETGSPAEQRAIRARWFQIIGEPDDAEDRFTRQHTYGFTKKETAERNWHRATFGAQAVSTACEIPGPKMNPNDGPMPSIEDQWGE